MFSSRLVFASTAARGRERALERLHKALDEVDAVVVGAGAGLSASAGFIYAGERFERHFHPWRLCYGFTDMYAGGFHPYSSLEEFWGFLVPEHPGQPLYGCAEARLRHPF